VALPRLEALLARQRREVGPDAVDLAATLDAVGGARHNLGDRDGARQAWEEALAILRRAGKAAAPEGLAVLSNLSITLDDPRRLEEIQRQRLAAATEIFGPESVAVAVTWNNLGVALSLQGRHAEAEAAFSTGLHLYERRFGPEHGDTANALRNVARAKQLQRRAAEALPLLRRALAIAARHWQPRGVAALRAQTARAAWVVERTPRALQELEDAAREVVAVATAAGDRYPADALTALGLSLHEAGRACDAVVPLRDALARRGGAAATATPGFGLETRCALRLAERACGQPTAAAELGACAADLPRWGLADPELLARFAAR
jgi:tetratricopeptide (TPR) repeat protein